MLDLIQTRRFWLMLGLSLVVPMFSIAQEDDDDEEEEEGQVQEQVDPNAWKEERERIYEAIKAEVKKRTEAIVTHPKIVAELEKKSAPFEAIIRPRMLQARRAVVARDTPRWKQDYNLVYPAINLENIKISPWVWPIKVSRFSPEQLKDKEAERLEALFREANPEPPESTLIAQGREKYKMIIREPGKPDPEVSFKLRSGRGLNTVVNGRLQLVTAERIRVGLRWINRVDLSDETAALFYKDVNDRFVDDYVKLEQRKYAAMLEGFVADWVMYLLPDVLMSENYVPDYYKKSKVHPAILRQSANLSQWISRKDFEKRKYDQEYEKERKRQNEIVEPEFFEHASEKGFRENYQRVKIVEEPAPAADPAFNPGMNPGEEQKPKEPPKEVYEWMPDSIAEEYRNRQNAAQNPDGFGGPGMPPR